MVFWVLSYAFFFVGLFELIPVFRRWKSWFVRDRSIQALRGAAAHVKLLQELLESGMVPSPKDWARVREFPAPWGRILTESLRDLRNEGAPILPTLERVHKTLQEQVEWLLEAKVKSAQALSQALVALLLIPGFSVILYLVLPGVREARSSFVILAFFSTLFSSFSWIWILSLSDQARFGKVRAENRQWWVSVHATVERILALISSGRPPDLAWRTAVEELTRSDPSLARAWGVQVWDPFEVHESGDESECERILISLGTEVRRSIQTSLIEGRGCLDRIETIHQATLADLKMRVQQELNLLPNRCLKPLFIFVLPGVVFLLSGSLWFSFRELGW